MIGLLWRDPPPFPKQTRALGSWGANLIQADGGEFVATGTALHDAQVTLRVG